MNHTIATLALELIDEPENPSRIGMDEAALCELADDIRANGLHQPIVVQPTGDGRYVVIAGHRRLLAHRIANLQTIQATVRTVDADAAKKIRFGENAHRENLSPMEEAREIAQIFDEETWDLAKIARALHRSTAWVEQRLELLRMPEELCVLVHSRQLPISHALQLAQIDDEPHRNYLTQFAIEGGASYAVLREWVRAYLVARDEDPTAAAPRPEMPIAGQPLTIQMPCFTCGEIHSHITLHIIRVCPGCHRELQKAGAA